MTPEAMAAAALAHSYGPDATQEDRAQYLTQRLLASELVEQWKQAVKNELAKPEYSAEEMRREYTTITRTPLYRALHKLGLVASLKRLVVDLHSEATRAAATARQQQARAEEATLIPPAHSDVLDVVTAARDNWDKITRDELLRFAKEHSKPLVALAQQQPVRSLGEDCTSDSDDGLAALAAISQPATAYKPPPSTRFLYDSQDLLQALQSIKPANRVATSPCWTSIQLELHCPSTADLRRTFSELAPAHGQIGVDDLFPTERQSYLAEKNRVGDVVLAHRSAAMARQYAKTGCPSSVRGGVWRQALGLHSLDRVHYQSLQELAAKWTFVTDDMYLLDLQRAIDSSDYFVFQDLLVAVVMAFTRDATVDERAPRVNGAVGMASTPADAGAPPPSTTTVPPNGVLPFSGLVMYVAPLAYVYADEAELYAVFRELYVRYWSRLNAIPSALPLCRLFEELVLRTSTAAVYHLLNVGLRPLDVAFPWLQSAFSGVLELKQTLLLWDRVVGYDAVELLAVAAAALFHYRADALVTVRCREDVAALYAELLDVQVVPLLQEYLFLLS